ncbi:midnolin homolog [Anopheles moucheti]|uniref:midnolin homolog n=1 Tax=Anopheles moucheti TaxID=186751 RepID=UPI0022EFFF38|nr:midnolin homolog [Anopheles moucheti]
MGGKHSRLQREQKHQQRKQKKEQYGSNHRVEQQEEAGGSGSTGGDGKLSDNSQLVVTAVHHHHLVPVESVTVRDNNSSPSVPGHGGVVDVAFESALNVTERDVVRVGRVPECNAAATREEEEDNAKSSVTITICMLKMEPNETGAEEAEAIAATGDSVRTVAEQDEGSAGPAEDVIAHDSLSRRQCACLENGNFGCSVDGPTADSGETVMRCSCSANTTGANDNRLNNNESPTNLPTPSTISSTPAAMVPAGVSAMSSNAANPNAVPVPPAVSFMIGGHDPATISHLLHRLRHLHHHHHHLHHHHHHHHLMHLHHLHHHHPVTGGVTDLPPDVAHSNTMDWRQQHAQHQWIPAAMVGSSNGAIVRPAEVPPGGSSVGPATAASPHFMDIDIDLKDKLEGLRLGPAPTSATGQRPSSNNNVTEESGEHPYSVGECPTCCAMAMAANASGSLGGLLSGSGGLGGASSSVANGTSIYNGNVGEVEEKILNTSNQPSVTPPSLTGGEKVPELSAPVVTSLAMDNSPSGTGVSPSSDQISTEPDNTEAGSSSVATSSAVGRTVPSTGKDAVRTVALEDNSSKPTAAAATASTASPSSANTTSDSPPATTVAAGSVVPPSSPADTKTIGPAATASSVVTSCCSRKSSSSTLFGSLSFAGRRSRSSNARTGSCCATAAGDGVSPAAAITTPEQQQQQRSRISWIPGSGQKQQRTGGAKNGRTDTATAVTSPGSAKSKKSNWPFSLKSSSGSSSQSRAGTTGTAQAAAHNKQTTKATTPGAGSASNGCASTSTAMAADMSNSIVSSAVANGGSSLRGSSLISSAKLLKGETDQDDSCVCTAYRKVSESPPPPSSPVPPVAASAGPSRVASPRPAESVEWLEEAIHGSGLLPLNLHMLSSLRSGNAGTAAQSMAGVSAPMISLSPEPIPASMLANHHHHHHHAMTAAALVADHHPTFFFSAAASGGSNHHAHHGPVGPGVGGSSAAAGQLFGTPANDVILLSDSPVLFDLTSDDFSVEDCDERARIQRELEIREGVDAPPNFHPRRLMSGGTIASGPAANHPIAFIYSRDLMQRGLLMANKLIQPLDAAGRCTAGRDGFGRLRIHSQVDFIHCLVPDLQKITSCSFYWGKMDRYEAERLLEGKPEGTFLLRDSAQEEFLFSVSFRKYNRSLHARIEQFNHKFSFDSRDPGVFTASTVTGLLEHYKDPSCVMFFEPMLTFPLNRNFSFSLQQLCRAVIVSNTTYDGINELTLPKSLKSYLKEYHYRQRVRFRPMDEHLYSNA